MRQYVLPLVLALLASPAMAQRLNSAGFPVKAARPPEERVVPGQPLPTNAPIAPNQASAFPGQSRAPAVTTKAAIEARVITPNLNRPWGIAFLGDDRAIVTEKPGAMRVVDLRSGTILGDVMGLPRIHYGGDAGLLDIAADPDFASNQQIYFTYVEPRGQTDNGLAVAKARIVGRHPAGQPPLFALEDLQVILRIEPGIANNAHYGSRLLFDREGYLFVSLAERFFSPHRDNAQSLYSPMGKILRIDKEGKPAPGNPFDRDQKAENRPYAAIWSYGHRNPQGLALHPQTGELWDSEHGPQGGDEINLIKRGANYGWPLVAYGTNYDGTPINGGRSQQDGTEQPRYYWDPAIAPSGITFYSGDLVPEWKNNLFVAALEGQHVARLVIDGDRIVGEERFLLDQQQRIRNVQQGPDGALYVLTDNAAGRLIRLVPKGR